MNRMKPKDYIIRSTAIMAVVLAANTGLEAAYEANVRYNEREVSRHNNCGSVQAIAGGGEVKNRCIRADNMIPQCYLIFDWYISCAEVATEPQDECPPDASHRSGKGEIKAGWCDAEQGCKCIVGLY